MISDLWWVLCVGIVIGLLLGMLVRWVGKRLVR